MTEKRNKNPCHRVMSAIYGNPWAIRPDALEGIIAIASRDVSDMAAVESMREGYRAGGENEPSSGVAVIDVIGPVFTRADFFTDVSGCCSIDRLTRAIDDAMNDAAVSGIVLRFDSPGGEVSGVHELANHIMALRDTKPIVAYVSGAACSAAYWLASATSYIFADRTASLGSIGVVAMWTDNSKSREAEGLKDYEMVSSQSPNKRLSRESDEGKAAIQSEIDGLADIFISDVASFRGVSAEKVMSDFGQGGTFLADDAIKAGMADEISDLRSVIGILSEQNSSTQQTDINPTLIPPGDQSMGAFERKTTKTRAEDTQQEEDRKEEDTGKEGTDHQGADDNPEKDEDDEAKRQTAESEGEPIEKEPDPEDEEQDKENETSATYQQTEQFARKNPAIYRAILRRGARRERQRIAAIEELAGPGRDALILSAKFTRPQTVSGAMRSIIRAEKQQREKLQDDLRADGAFNVPKASSAGGTSAVAAEEKSILEQIKAGAKAAKGVMKV